MRRQRDGGMLLAVRRVLEASLDILLGQVGKIFDDFRPGHPRRNPPHHVADRNSQAANARFSTAFAWFDRNDFPIIHAATGSLPLAEGSRKPIGGESVIGTAPSTIVGIDGRSSDFFCAGG